MLQDTTNMLICCKGPTARLQTAIFYNDLAFGIYQDDLNGVALPRSMHFPMSGQRCPPNNSQWDGKILLARPFNRQAAAGRLMKWQLSFMNREREELCWCWEKTTSLRLRWWRVDFQSQSTYNTQKILTGQAMTRSTDRASIVSIIKV